MINKTVRITKCYGQRLGSNGEFEDYYIELPGFLSLEKATRMVRRSEKDPMITINKIEHYQSYYRMSVSDFIRDAEFIKEVRKENN